MSLAPETLSEIFMFALPVDESYTHSRTESPLNVSQVSRSWRQLAISVSPLWSRLSLIHSDPSSSSENRTRHIHRILRTWNLWLIRSKTRPLKITIRKLGDVSDSREENAVKSLLDKTFANFHRWMDIEIVFTAASQTYLALVPAYPSTLERLVLVMNMDIFPLSSVPASVLSTLRSLRGTDRPFLRESNPRAFLYLIGHDTFPWSLITHDLEDRSVSISNLRCLAVFGRNHKAFLSRYIFPSLRELTVAGTERVVQASPTGISSLIQRSNASLKSLYLDGVEIGADELRYVLLGSPMLEKLCMRNCAACSAQDVFDLLTIQTQSPDANVLWPRLSKITFTGWSIESIETADSFVDMVESRWNCTRSRDHPGILSVRFENCLKPGVEFSSSHSKALSRCISEGLVYAGKPP